MRLSQAHLQGQLKSNMTELSALEINKCYKPGGSLTLPKSWSSNFHPHPPGILLGLEKMEMGVHGEQCLYNQLINKRDRVKMGGGGGDDKKWPN